jgi:hypothetical protein
MNSQAALARERLALTAVIRIRPASLFVPGLRSPPARLPIKRAGTAGFLGVGNWPMPQIPNE